MSHRSPARWFGHRRVLIGLALGALVLASGRPQAAPAPEIRALWVLRSSLASLGSIDQLIATARTYGFNTLLVQVRGRGDAYYASTLEPRAAELDGQPTSFDPLDTLLSAAHQAGLRVHAWVNVNFVSSAFTLPAAPEHVVYRHPEWLMVPKALAREMSSVDPGSPAYLGRLARWTRNQTDVEGLYTSPLSPGVAAHDAAIITELVTRYPLDGVHLDYLRYPDDRFDYSPYALAAFRADVLSGLPAAERRRLDGLASRDPLAFVDALPVEWSRFRRARLSSLVMRLRTAVKPRRPDALVSAAVAPDAAEAFATRLQDWRTWLDNGLLDAVCPMAYTPDASIFASQIAAARSVAGARAVWAGIGSYRLTAAETVSRIRAARQQGADGVILFSYDALAEAPRSRETYLSQVSRAAFADAAGSR
jgi:uncharacterized lipoprotein YddW (UPF0748 family)